MIQLQTECTHLMQTIDKQAVELAHLKLIKELYEKLKQDVAS